jgi:long-chain acyl-CoA synthetase
VDKFGSGLQALNCIPSCGDPVLDNKGLLGIYSRNVPEWIVAEQACYAFGAVPVPMYDTYSPEEVAYTINMCNLTTVVVHELKLEAALAAKDLPGTETFANIIVIGNIPPAAVTTATSKGLTVLGFGDVEARGTLGATHSAPQAKDVMTFCFTSGTTGDAKGALLTHENMVSDLAGCMPLVEESVPTPLEFCKEVHCSYLPLPHVFERLNFQVLAHYGGCVGFYQGDPLKLVDDLLHLRPTVFASVPRLLNRIHDKLRAGVKEGGGLKEKLFNMGYKTKVENMKNHGKLTHPWWDKLVFSKVKAKVGLDRVKYMITGSAPISEEVMTFLRCVFCVPVLEGYGQTECCAAATITDARDVGLGTVGGPVAVNDMKLVDVADMKYLSTDRDHNGTPCLGRGEICFRGPNVFKGYYKMPEKTAECIDSEGWVHSGDIGIWTTNGKIKIVDRKKNIFKLSQGEYVAAEKIEIINQKSPFIMQNFVYGDSFQDCLVAIVTLDPDYVPQWAKQNGVQGSLQDLSKNPKLKAAILAEIKRLHGAEKLAGFELVKDIFLEPVAWTPDDLLTPTFKLKRAPCQEKYKPAIDAMYAELTKNKKPAKL